MLLMMVAVAANPAGGPDAGASNSPRSGTRGMPAQVRALFGALIEPVTGTSWSVPLFDRRETSDIFVVTVAKELPKSIEGVQLSRLSAGASVGRKGFVLVGSGGAHLVIPHRQDDGQLGVYGGNFCGQGVGGLALGRERASEWGACWNGASRRFTMKVITLPQVDAH